MSDKISLFNDYVFQSALQRASRGCGDHKRINVEGIERAQCSSRGFDREGAIAAPKLDSVTTQVAKTKRVQTPAASKYDSHCSTEGMPLSRPLAIKLLFHAVKWAKCNAWGVTHFTPR